MQPLRGDLISAQAAQLFSYLEETQLTPQILSEVSRREKSLSPPPIQVSHDSCPVSAHDATCQAEPAATTV